MNILVINGPNLNMLGLREPDIYGTETYADMESKVLKAARELDMSVDFFQSNHEGDLVDAIQDAYNTYDGVIINAGAYTHTSIAILDAARAVGLPMVEVHVTDPEKREPYRYHSYIREACIGTVAGKGVDGYVEALKMLKK